MVFDMKQIQDGVFFWNHWKKKIFDHIYVINLAD